MELEHVYLIDSWVLNVDSDDRRGCFVIDAVLEREHERFYWPPRPGEQHAYARISWCLEGEVWWNDGPHLDKPTVDLSGERDFGGIDAWFKEGDVDHLEGDWGSVAIRGARETVEYFDN